MNIQTLSTSELLTIAGAFAGCMAGSVAMTLVILSLKGRGWGLSLFGGRKKAQQAAERLEEFAAKVNAIENKQRVLNSYSGEYFNAFQEAGWSTLITLIENLRTVENSLRVMVEQRQFSEVIEVCDLLMGRLSDEQSRRIYRQYDDLDVIKNWREESRSILLRLVDETTTAAHATKHLGIERKRAGRRPTLVSLGELRNTISDV